MKSAHDQFLAVQQIKKFADGLSARNLIEAAMSILPKLREMSSLDQRLRQAVLCAAKDCAEVIECLDDPARTPTLCEDSSTHGRR